MLSCVPMTLMPYSGGEDLYVSDMDKVISCFPELSLCYTLHITISTRSYDTLEIHVECADDTYMHIQKDIDFRNKLVTCIAIKVGILTSIVWENWQQILIDYANHVDLTSYNERMSQKSTYAMSHLECKPSVTFFELGKLPKNPRTGKIPRIVDHRNKL